MPPFRELMQNPRFDNFPMILETPKENINSDKLNLDLLRKILKIRIKEFSKMNDYKIHEQDFHTILKWLDKR